MTGSDQARWVGVSDKDREDKIFKAIKPQPEITVTQELRQKAFDNHQTTDDHATSFRTKEEPGGWACPRNSRPKGKRPAGSLLYFPRLQLLLR